MTQRLVHRPARTSRPLGAARPRPLAPPPALGGTSHSGLPLQSMLPVLGAVSSMTMMLLLRTNPAMVVVAMLVLVVALVGGVGMALSQRSGAARTRRDQRERYLDHLEELRGDLLTAEREERRTAHALDPAPTALLDLARDPARRWERRRWDPDYLHVRVGVGDVPRARLHLQLVDQPSEPPDPMLLAEAHGLAGRHSHLREVPVMVPLDGAGEVSVIGARSDVLGVARSMLLQLTALHAPQDLQIALAVAGDRLEDWRGADLLPHLVDDTRFDGPAPVRRVAPDLASLRELLRNDLGRRAADAAERRRRSERERGTGGPRLVIFTDAWGGIAPAAGTALPLAELGITVVHLLADRLQEPSEVGLRVVAVPGGEGEPATLLVEDLRPAAVGGDAGPRVTRARSDAATGALLRGLAHTLAPLRLELSPDDAGGPAVTRAVGTDELLGIPDVTGLDTASLWAPREPQDFLRVPIGVDDDGAPVLVDLKESAQLGMGPHGLCVGATGSGKSELLRTLVAALAASHPPEDLALILVDYKGGAAFAPFADLPHVAGILDNLADDPGLTERARSSFAGEVVRRQQVLRAAGSPSITHYRQLRRTRRDLEPLPHLLLVIDEFGELLTVEPEFVDLLLMIGRIGRSIGVHLLLSSQRIEAGKLRGLEAYLSYRIGLRTFSESESSVVLDTPDAFHLPAVPGFGYLKVDTSVYQRFRAGYVSGPVAARAVEPEPDADLVRPLRLGPFNGVRAENGISAAPATAFLDQPTTDTPMVDVIVRQLSRAGERARPVWLNPLPAGVTLGEVLARDRVPAADELRTGSGRSRLLAVPVGLIDDPARQRQDLWELDLTRSGGHVVLLGAPQSGRTTFLWTLVAGLAMTHTPLEVAVYGMDLSGGGLARIEGFPHVGSVATRAARDRLQRLLEELLGMLAVRERVFASHGIDSLAMLRERHAAGLLPELPSADVVLLVDGVGLLRQDFEELEEGFAELMQRGGGFGLHVVATAARWNDLRPALQNLVGTRLELRLNDPTDSTVARKLSAVIRPGQSGRVLTDESLFAQTALPLLDPVTQREAGDDPDAAQERTAAVGAGVEDLARRSALSWAGPAAPPIRLLPRDLSTDELPNALDEPDLVPFGLRQDSMGPALLDLPGRDQHLLVLGDSRAGRSTLLRTIVRGLVDRYSADELVVAVYDVRSSVIDACPDDYLGGHASNPSLALGLTAAVAAELEKRSLALSTARRGGFDGPRIVVVSDDHDILTSGGTDPLRGLLPFLPAARDLRLHVLLARPVAGASRALYEPVIQAVRDTGGSALVMSGERSEGQLHGGVRAETMPPGRGRWVRRGARPVLVQVARTPEPAYATGGHDAS